MRVTLHVCVWLALGHCRQTWEHGAWQSRLGSGLEYNKALKPRPTLYFLPRHHCPGYLAHASTTALWCTHVAGHYVGQHSKLSYLHRISLCRFVEAAKRAAASHKPSAPQQQSIAALLSTPPLLLACDAASLSFWDASAAAAHRAATSPPPATYHDRHRTAQYVVSPSSWWPRPQLSGGLNRGARSQVVKEVVELVQEEQHRNRQQVEAIGRAEAGGDGAGGM